MNNQNEMSFESQRESDEQKSHELSFIGSLLPGILHNLATPLSGVIGATQLMEMRNADQDQLLERLESANEEAAKELITLFEKNKTNLDIIGRNANQLIELLQVMVQRFQRSSVHKKLPQSLNELLTNELAFLHANLVFKHKVRRDIQMADEPFAVSMVYPHIVAVIDEFVTGVAETHDTKQGIAEMGFTTAFSDDTGRLLMKASFIPIEGNDTRFGSIRASLERAHGDGCEFSFDTGEDTIDLRLTIPK